MMITVFWIIEQDLIDLKFKLILKIGAGADTGFDGGDVGGGGGYDDYGGGDFGGGGDDFGGGDFGGNYLILL